MDPATLLRDARCRAGLTLRQHAARAGTSHATLSAYEQGRVSPGSATLERLVRAAGFALDVRLAAAPADDQQRGQELWQALELADMFPSRPAPSLPYPRFADS